MEKTTKKPKAELIAIYRLEFYKKQNSWKLNKDIKRKKYKLEKKNIFNKTYDVDEPKTQSCLLNEAFVETDSDKDKSNLQSPSTPTKYECLSHNYPTTQPLQKQIEKCTDAQQWINPVLKFQEKESESTWDRECWTADQDWLDFHSYPGQREGYWVDSNENWMHTSTFDQLWSKDVSPAINELDCGDNAATILCHAENWLQKDDHLWLPDEADINWMNENMLLCAETEGSAKSEESADSWLEFMRGADIAPHSSKIVLTLPEALSEVDVCGDSLARLSSEQLKEAVRAHSFVLRRLLSEETERRRIRSCLSLSGRSVERPVFAPRPATDCSSCDEQPTRDFDPSLHSHTGGNPLHRERTFAMAAEDMFLAGSHRNADLEVLGRGRGRLQSARGRDSRDVIIGIGRGRPFRQA
ncbi:unnamed protein product, partial [Iphiclides podalirius]